MQLTSERKELGGKGDESECKWMNVAEKRQKEATFSKEDFLLCAVPLL